MTDTDIIIVGAGVTSALTASKLAKDYSVTVLEAGPDERDFSIPIKNYIRGIKPWPAATAAPSPSLTGATRNYLETSGNYPFNSHYLRRVGGRH